ncbi:exodeoxyribonuclease 7 large subunit [Endomicrobiia bacterium]|nr:exodeoxyribonuclease 7 large subunit [Endomicrobiia bacterium]GHT74438.1 exodeoxyribonuclease 7 large subunit [Endomicrobiia bacterium]
MFKELEEDGRLVYTVTQISNEIKLILEDSYPAVWIQGEISNFKLYNSGHMYFNVKDSNAQIKAVMFKNVNIDLKFAPQDGIKVLVYGRINSYPKNGDYQIIVNHMEQYGKGELYEAYEQLKKKLEAEGLFNENVKKTIPDIVNKIGVVTSRDGAALHDILKVIDSLNVNVEVLVYSVRVQGEEAQKEIPKAITYLNLYHKDLDVLLVGRGGGSVEDLWAFNTEPVARAIFGSKIPIVSCIGHEVDFTIADFVADMRAPTPSAAAEMILRKRSGIEKHVEFLKESLYNAVSFILDDRAGKLNGLMSSRALLKPYLIYEEKIAYVDSLYSRLLNNIQNLYEVKFEKLKDVAHKLDIVSPISVLKRGFAVCFDSNNKIIRETKNINTGDIVNIKLFSGNFTAKVETKQY